MTFSNPTLLTAAALGVLITLGAVAEAPAGQGYGPHAGYAGGGYHAGYAMPNGYGHPAVYGAGYGQAMGKSCDNKMTDAKLVRTGLGGAAAQAPAAAAPAGDLVDIAVGSGSFNTLVEAVKAAGLVETLKGPGPFTVFAPTDEAFAQIPAADLQALLADKERLTAVLTYHVVPGKVTAAQVAGLDSAKTVQGGTVTIETTDGVTVDGANVVQTDIMASNGVIHVIDRVIMPN
jgi:uncharacterized surface protein with fasciclin (FAS1) repeats